MKDSRETFRELRSKHPALHYRSFEMTPAAGELHLRYSFLLEPDIEFFPEISIPLQEDTDIESLRPLVFNLGMVEAISYWKCACPPVFKVLAGPLSEEQAGWWHDLFIHGLSEFYFINQIDFRIPDLLHIESADSSELSPSTNAVSAADLIMVGGGKDSVVTLELLQAASNPAAEERKTAALFVNPPRSALESAEIAGYSDSLVLKRSIDPKLLELNKLGYLNGHTPFSAFLAFSGVLASAAKGYRRVLASNESSASEGNAVFHGLEINHQYSKSFRFESRFRDYCHRYLHPEIEYLSFLRPLLDLQITSLFARFPQHFSSFRSCNVGQRNDVWCQQCPKCVFVFICLYPFVERSAMASIFGDDLYQLETSYPHLRGLCGLDPVKPLECVGSREESIVALHLARIAHEQKGESMPPLLQRIIDELGEAADDNPRGQGSSYTAEHCRQLLESWNTEHFLSDDLQKTLRNALNGVVTRS